MNKLTGAQKPDSPGQVACDSCGVQDCVAAARRQGESENDFEARQKLQSRLCRIQHVVVVLSGKGGVGKSTVAVNLATALMMSGLQVGLLDVDIHGPSVPTMLNLEGTSMRSLKGELVPIDIGGLRAMSIGFLLRDQDDAVIWRGPLKNSLIKEFLTDVAWGDLDYLIVDCPPGTGDEPLSVVQLIGKLDGAVVVTTPQKVAAVDVRKAISFCRQLKVEVIGVVENMAGFVCPKCGEITDILPSGGGRKIAEDMDVRFLGSIPMDPRIAASCDQGRVLVQHYPKTPTARILMEIARRIRDRD